MFEILREHLAQIIATAIVLALLPFTKFVSRKLTRKYAQLLQKPEARVMQVRQIINIFLNITFLFLLAIIWGLKPENLLIGLSSIFAFVGVAMFAQWSILSNVTAGIIMFFSAPYRVGDQIRIIDKDVPLSATIESIQAFYMHLRTDEDNELVVLPNNLFLQKIVAVRGKSNNYEV